jgi:DNA-binding transcriptional ArsR family regulator
MTIKSLPEKQLKKIFLNDIVSLLQKGVNPSKIARQLNTTPQTINHYIKTLKAKGLIKKIGYGTWETTKNITEVTNEVRGHAFLWKIKLEKKIDWTKLLINKNIQFKLIQSNKALRVIINDKKVWLNKQSIIIYDKDSYFSSTALETRKQAVYTMIETINILKNKLDINFDITKFKVSRNHYALIKNNLAIQCDKEGKRINISNSDGLWFIIDNSYNLHEAEAVHPKTGLIDINGLQNYLNSHKDTNWKVTPDFILNSLNQVTNNQLMFAKNIETHMQVLTDIQKAINELNHTMKQLLK